MLETPIPNLPVALKHVGVVGLGHMGHAFAVNLLQDGYPVLAYDRDARRASGIERRASRSGAGRFRLM